MYFWYFVCINKSSPQYPVTEPIISYLIALSNLRHDFSIINDILERAFNRAFHFEEGPKSLTPAPVKEQNRW